MFCQWLAWRLRLPAILLLLLAGLLIGPASAWMAGHGWIAQRLVDPDDLFGGLLLPVVSLSVAIILFEGGLTLDLRKLRLGRDVLLRLTTAGTALSWALTAITARGLLGMPWGLSVLVGAILVVTGPTVIGPLLRFVRPAGPVGPVLRWEGIVIDPIGALLAVLVFEILGKSGGGAFQVGLPEALVTIAKTATLGGAMGLGAAGLLVLLLRRDRAPDHLHNALAVALVLVVFAVSNAFEHEAGLAAVTVMGIALANQRRVHVEHILEFKESLTILLVSTLFVVLGARLKVEQLAMLDWRAVMFVVALIVLVRPIAVLAATARSSLPWRERLFLMAMAPRGIVAAAVASVFALRLNEQGYPQADRLVPVIFAVVAGTVCVYGLLAPFVSSWLGLSKPGQSGMLIIGADAVARAIGETIQREGYEVLLVDTNAKHIQQARLAGLPVMIGNALAPGVGEAIELSSIGRVMALTPNGEVNALAAVRFARDYGRDNVFQLAGEVDDDRRRGVSSSLQGHKLFGPTVTHGQLAAALQHGATVKTTRLTREFDYEHYIAQHGTRATPLLIIAERHELEVVTAEMAISPRPGQTVVSLIEPTPAKAGSESQ